MTLTWTNANPLCNDNSSTTPYFSNRSLRHFWSALIVRFPTKIRAFLLGPILTINGVEIGSVRWNWSFEKSQKCHKDLHLQTHNVSNNKEHLTLKEQINHNPAHRTLK